MPVQMKKNYLLLVITASFAFSQPSQAAVRTWTAAANGAWSTASNWSGNLVPTINDDVIFDGTSVRNCAINVAGSGAVCKSLSINSGYTGAVTLASNRLLSVNGNFIQSDGTFNVNGRFRIIGGDFNVTAGTYDPITNNGITEFSLSAGVTSDIDGTVSLFELAFFSSGSGECFVDFGTSITADQVVINLSNITSFTGNLDILYSFNIQSGVSGTPTQNTGSFTFPDGTNNGGGGPNGGMWVDFYNGSGSQIQLPKIVLGSTSGGGVVNLNHSIPATTLELTAVQWDLLSNSGSSLTVNSFLNAPPGSILGTSDALILGADARLSSLDPIGAGGGFISGKVNVITTALAGRNTNWTNLSVSGVDGVTVNDWQTQIPMTCVDCNFTPSSVGNFTSIQMYDATNCNYKTDLVEASNLDEKDGFWVYRGNSSPGSASPAMTWSFTGALVQGDQAITLVTGCAGGDYNLIGNPFAGPVDLDVLWNNNGAISSVFSIWDPNTSGGSFVTYDANTNTGNPILAKGQAVYVDANGQTSMTFVEAAKASSNTSLLKSSGSKHEMLDLNLAGYYENDKTTLVIQQGASLNKDQFEAYKMKAVPAYNGMTQPWTDFTMISTQDKTGHDFVIQAIPPQSNSLTIPIMTKVRQSGSFTISASNFQNYSSCIILKDLETNQYHDLRKGPLVATLQSTMTVPRFELVVCATEMGAVVSVDEMNANSWLEIQKSGDNAIVKTLFANDTEASITVMNLLGQSIMPDIKVNGRQSETSINLERAKDQVVLIRVSSEKGTAVKKLLVN
jgi:hypothetical protein